jgi:hypothetical protein
MTNKRKIDSLSDSLKSTDVSSLIYYYLYDNDYLKSAKSFESETQKSPFVKKEYDLVQVIENNQLTSTPSVKINECLDKNKKSFSSPEFVRHFSVLCSM